VRQQREHAEQATVVLWAKLHENKYPALRRLYANANQGSGSVVRGRRMKEEGVRPGVSDLFLAYPMNGKHGLYLEIKAETGRLSPDQNRWIDESRTLGYEAFTAWGYKEAIGIICDYLDIKGEPRNV
jgi:hypothetical protein